MLPSGQPGQGIFRIDFWATAGFAGIAILALVLPDLFRIPFAVVSTSLFAGGVMAFLAAFGHAVGRSRTDAINLPGIYGLSASSPKAVQHRFHALTFIQVAVAIFGASIRPFTAQAFGILVPMLGIGLGGLWAARHGIFDERDNPRNTARRQVKEAFSD